LWFLVARRTSPPANALPESRCLCWREGPASVALVERQRSSHTRSSAPGRRSAAEARQGPGAPGPSRVIERQALRAHGYRDEPKRTMTSLALKKLFSCQSCSLLFSPEESAKASASR